MITAELNTSTIEIANSIDNVAIDNTNITAGYDNSYNVDTEDLSDLDITVAKKEYTIVGDGIFIPSMYEDSPPWLKELIDTTIDVAVGNRDQSLVDRLRAILTAMDYVPKNQYTEQINQIISEDGIINSRIATLNSNLVGAINTTNATIAEINLTYASKNEAAAIASNVITASLSGSGEIGSALIQLQEAYANLESTTAQSVSMLESVMEGEINGNATAMETIRTYVGINEAGASTSTGLSAYLQASNGVIGGADSRVANDIRVTAQGIESKWEYNSTVNVNGVYRKSGFGLTGNNFSGNGSQANPYTSEFWIDATKLRFTNSANSGRTAPFTIDATGATPQIKFNGVVTFSNISDSATYIPTISSVTTAQTTANTAITNAATANALLADIASDSKLTPDEKIAIKKEWDIIVSEYGKNTTQANSHGVSSSAYTTIYNSLSSYITPLLSNLSTTSTIVGNTFRTNFKNYYDARTDLLNAIATKIDSNAQAAANTANSNALARTLPSEVAHAINTNTTTINGSKITTGSITAAQIKAQSISADRLLAGTNATTVWTGGGLVSDNFNGNPVGNIGNPTQGFRLSSNAAGTKTDPNIYGAYIKGGILEGSNLWLSTPAGYAKVQHLDMVYSNFAIGPGPLPGTTYSDYIELVSPTYGSGYLPNRVFSLGSSIISIITTGAINSTAVGINLSLQYSADGGAWTKLDKFSGNLPGVNVIYYGLCPDFSSILRIRLSITYVNFMAVYYSSTASAALTLINQN